MNKWRQNLSPEQLHERIARLEIELTRLKAEVIPQLEAKNAALDREFMEFVKIVEGHIGSATEAMADIHTALWPVVYRVFPGTAEADGAIQKILEAQRGSKKRADKPE